MNDNDITKVVFRKWKENGLGKNLTGDGIIALFPEWIVNEYKHFCQSYEHVGQHGGADYAGVIRGTRPAEPEEYAALKKELENIGYKLLIRKRR